MACGDFILAFPIHVTHFVLLPFLVSPADVPELTVLETKFGSFEHFVRGKLSDASKMWLDEAPTIFDGSAQAWSRVITCTKNLADNAALNVFGKVSEAFAKAHFAKEKQRLLNQAVFVSGAVQAANVTDPEKVKTETINAQRTTFTKKLNTCVQTQLAMVNDLFAQAHERFVRNTFRPQGVVADNRAKPVQTEIENGFKALLTSALVVIEDAIQSAAKRAQSVPNMALTAAMFVNPALGGSVYCGDNTVCMNGGRCVALNLCACPAEWKGASCTEPVDTCAALNIRCAGQTYCTAPNGEWQCNCPAGFAGLYCERYDPASPGTPQPTSPELPQIQLATPYTDVVSAALLSKLRRAQPFLQAQMPIRDFKMANAAQAAYDRAQAAKAINSASLLELEQDSRVEADVVDSHVARTSEDDMYL